MKRVVDYMLTECAGKSWDWALHLRSVAHYANILADKLDADKEICALAAWLHDVDKIQGGVSETHHIIGSQKAADVLNELGYTKDIISQVQHCILTHSSDERYPPISIEAKILASADALCGFDSFLAFAQWSFIKKNENVEQCRETLRKKYAKAWKKLLLEEAQAIAKPKYAAITMILENEGGNAPNDLARI